jgi:ubiquinone/menaquinone biosynthesis C-methylase UbiE
MWNNENKMTKLRVSETDHGIQGDIQVIQYDQMQRHLRDKGWIETDQLIKSGILEGHALEIGHGPGYLGLEWLRQTCNSTLIGLDISPDMTRLAKKNAAAYGLQDRVRYDSGQGDNLPYADNTFDAVFSNGSLHEWVNPVGTFNVIYRVLKPGGRYFVSDLRRDMVLPMRWFLWLGCQPAVIRPYLGSSIDAAYTPDDLKKILQNTICKGAQISGNLVGVSITGQKG